MQTVLELLWMLMGRTLEREKQEVWERKGTLRRQEGKGGMGTRAPWRGKNGCRWGWLYSPDGGRTRQCLLAFLCTCNSFLFMCHFLCDWHLPFPVDWEPLKAGPVAALFTDISSGLTQSRCSKNICGTNTWMSCVCSIWCDIQVKRLWGEPLEM